MKEIFSRRKVLGALAASLVGVLTSFSPSRLKFAEAAVSTTKDFDYLIRIDDYLKAGLSGDDAFYQANLALKSAIDSSTLSEGHKTGRAKIIIPPGRIVITKPETFLLSPDTRTLGLIIEGQGRGVSEIVFQPKASGQYLIVNNDKWLGIEIRDVSFECSHNSFMSSVSNGGAQNYIFNRVNWSNVQYGFRLRGSNNNSELTFNQCGISGSIDTFLWSETSDQFLNYNFFSCNFEVSSGDFCRFDKGGNINIWGGSFIHTTDVGGTFFRLLGVQHSFGVMRFHCEGVRFEHRKGESRLIECEWESGSVSFSSCDMSSQAFDYDHSHVTALFSSNNSSMPIIHFDDCMILGRHQYNYMVSSHGFKPLVNYNHCEIYSGSSPQQFIIINNKDGSTNVGGAPPIQFTHCRGLDANEVWECVYNYQINCLAVLTKKTLSIKNADGKFPYRLSGIVTAKLPLNAIITRIILSIPAGAATYSDTNDFTIQTSAGVKLLEQKTGTLNQGFVNDLNDLLIICDNDDKRTISFMAGSTINQAVGKGAMCLIEYLG